MPRAAKVLVAPDTKAAVRAAVSVLARGGMVAIPTETFYGLAVRALDSAALERLVVAKGREMGKTIPLIAGSREQACELAILPPTLEALASRFWPGPLTLALLPRITIPPQLRSPAGSMGIRVCGHPLARALALDAGVITATSANLSAGVPCCDPTRLEPRLLSAVDLVLDAGTCAGGAPSTVAGIEDERVVIFREGAVSREALASVLGYKPQLAQRGHP
jgi:L-threonylcarbamoyladenylate synthase